MYLLQSGASWKIHHEAASRVHWLAEDASTEREVLVCDNRWDFLVGILWCEFFVCENWCGKESSVHYMTVLFAGSHVDFASHVASYALGEDWWAFSSKTMFSSRVYSSCTVSDHLMNVCPLPNVYSGLMVRKDLFDIVIFFARKPSFFIDRRPFWKLEAEKEVKCLDKLVTDVPIGSATFC